MSDTYYVPGTEEPDPKKTIMSLQQAHEKTAANTDDIATNTTAIATNAAAIAAVAANLAALTGSPITASLGANVALNNTANFFDGPSVAQGSTGTWFASGQVNLSDAGGVATYIVKLWDGTNVIASTAVNAAVGAAINVPLSGKIAAPAGNIRISVRDVSFTSGLINFNASGLSKDSTITAYRVA